MNSSASFDYRPYRKPTDPGIYLNASSECPDRYKDGTISALIHRTFKFSSNGMAFQQSITNLKQSFVNNGYSNTRFDSVFNKYMQKISSPPEATQQEGNTIEVYYKNQFSSAYKTDEKVMNDIIGKNVKCVNDNDRLKLVIYYKSMTTKSLVMKNNQNTPPKSAPKL